MRNLLMLFLIIAPVYAQEKVAEEIINYEINLKKAKVDQMGKYMVLADMTQEGSESYAIQIKMLDNEIEFDENILKTKNIKPIKCLAEKIVKHYYMRYEFEVKSGKHYKTLRKYTKKELQIIVKDFKKIKAYIEKMQNL